MNKEEIKDYLKRVDELGTKLTGKDKETYAWLIHGFNQCAKLLNEAEQENKQLKIQISAREEVCNRLENNWIKLKEYIRKNIIYDDVGMKILDSSPLEDYMQELEQGSDSNE